MKNEYALNKYNLAHLGLLEEFYALHQSIVDVHNEAAKKMKSSNTKSSLSIDKLEKESWSKTRKLLDDFLIKNTGFFTTKYTVIHPNADAIRRIQLIEVKRTAPLKLTYSVVSFSDFIERFQDFVCDILTRCESYERPHISREYIWNDINEHIEELAVEKIKRSVKDGCVDKAQELIVYKNLNTISCNIDNHNIHIDKVSVMAIGKDYLVVLPVHKCNDCGKIFVGYETLKVYEKAYGQLFIIKSKEDEEKGCVYSFKSESPLHKAGYNVIEGMMTETERRSLLVAFLTTNTFSHFEICRDIENAIRIFEGQARFVNAVSKWKSDLMFIGEFVKEEMTNGEN